MAEVILSINAGSSSLKVSVFKDTRSSSSEKDLTQLAEVQVDGLTSPPAKLKYTRGDKKIKDQEISGVKDQSSAFQYILDQVLNDEGLPEVKDKGSIHWACHRVVHGGDYSEPQIINKETFHKLEELSDLAPLHNAAALELVKAISQHLPDTTNLAFFDSMYHQTIPKHIATYPIDPKIAQRNKLRKYGFHGISYSFIATAVAAHLSKPPDQLNIIALHLGSGASACAVRHGASLDTSMGLTPLAGLPGATRSGSVDPSMIFHYTHDAGRPSHASTREMHITAAEEVLNKQSGWKALTGTTDFGEISAKAERGEEGARLAFDLLVDRILDFVGAYYLKLRGEVDALVFAGGIGEKGSQLRTAVVDGVSCIGFAMDAKKNEEAASTDEVVFDLSASGAAHKVLVCQTDEQLEMARGYAKFKQ